MTRQFIFTLITFAIPLGLFLRGAYRFTKHIGLYRIMQNLPTFKLRSASQGYVELIRNLKKNPTPIIAPASKTICSWWRCSIDRFDGYDKHDKERWAHISTTSSTEPFLLDHGTDICLIYPEGATIKTSYETVWSNREPDKLVEAFINYIKPGSIYRYTEQYLFPHDHLYALGELKTRNTKEQLTTTKEVIQQWKQDYTNLVKKFDRDRNGLIDTREWELVRLSAKLESEDTRLKSSSQPLEHCIIKPKANLPYMLSSLSEESLLYAYKRELWIDIASCLAGAIALLYIINKTFIS